MNQDDPNYEIATASARTTENGSINFQPSPQQSVEQTNGENVIKMYFCTLWENILTFLTLLQIILF